MRKKILIVEDEVLVREGLKTLVDWKRLDMDIIGLAANGVEALEIYEQEKPDIILTDIKMPMMDGLEMIARIREKDEGIRIVLLTCYEEFGYLQEALRLGVSDYILKLKMKPDEIENAMERIGRRMDEKQGQEEPDDRNEKQELPKQDVFYHQISSVHNSYDCLSGMYGECYEERSARGTDVGKTSGEKAKVSVEIYNAIRYMEGNLTEKLTLNQVAEKIHLSPNYLSSLFKKELGVSFVDYIAMKRVEKARTLLETTDLRIHEVAELTGFMDDSYFSKIFKKITGKRPGAFRKRDRE